MDSEISSTSDFINNLPDNLVENVLMHLPLRDAVRTSILSKSWRHKWKIVPQLVFDQTFEENLKPQPPKKNELLLTIYQVLLLHRGPITKFTLSISGLESCSEIDHVVQFLSRNGIQELTLCVKSGQHYKVPSCLFSCLELRKLNLSSCLFKPPVTFNGFNRLVGAKFENVIFDTNVVQSFIMQCPLLEDLTLQNCDGVDCLDIYAPNLKALVVINILFRSIRFRCTPLLSEAIIGGRLEVPEFEEGQEVDMHDVFGCLPSIESLYLGFYFLMVLAVRDIPDRLPTPFNHLKTLGIKRMCFNMVAEVSCALCLIKSSPNLQNLCIYESYDEANGNANAAVELLKVQNESDVTFYQLKEVKMIRINGSEPEVEFVKLLLAKSPLLERMYVYTAHKETRKELSLLKKITRCRRASTVAEIIC